MNKKTKGAIITGLGVALLLGGGGTLAWWNVEVDAQAGTIVAGDLNLESPTGGQWESDVSGTIVNINDYRVVPGETLTFTQPLVVTLVGDSMAATLEVTETGINGGEGQKAFEADTVEVGPVVLKDANGQTMPAELTELEGPQDMTASTTFQFLGTTGGRDSHNAQYDFSEIGYKLQQKELTPRPAP